jgi:hypothetical protein
MNIIDFLDAVLSCRNLPTFQRHSHLHTLRHEDLNSHLICGWFMKINYTELA